MTQLADFLYDGKIYTGWSREEALASGISEQAMDAIELDLARSQMICTPRQARLALAGAGLLGAAEAWIAGSDEATRITWEYATEIRRDSPVITGAAAALELSDAQIDALFEAAMQL